MSIFIIMPVPIYQVFCQDIVVCLNKNIKLGKSVRNP